MRQARYVLPLSLHSLCKCSSVSAVGDSALPSSEHRVDSTGEIENTAFGIGIHSGHQGGGQRRTHDRRGCPMAEHLHRRLLQKFMAEVLEAG